MVLCFSSPNWLRQEATEFLGLWVSVGLLRNFYASKDSLSMVSELLDLECLPWMASYMRSSICTWPYLRHGIFPSCTPHICVYHFKTSNTVNPQRSPVSHWNVLNTSLQIRPHCLSLLTLPSSSMYSQAEYGFLRDKNWNFCFFCIPHST